MPPRADQIPARGRADFGRQVARVRTEAAKAGYLATALHEAAEATDNPGVAELLRDLATQGREGRVALEQEREAGK